ncbi:Sulfotransferase 1C4 [Eumeta japonica]|uniref:Sulfotransferase 1C4 n=1 Tax=Eumeta variegata TaxID=151549 RepID=A0A4C1UNV5_EUMVA|nr:Sulfotransferase 1C4 [Eumeta japonica]
MDILNNNEYPLEIEELEPKITKELMELFTGEHTGFVRVGPKGYLLPHRYTEEALNIYSMAIRPSDIFVASYPRSGTTWTQELVWMVANDLDYATSRAIPLTQRYPFLEFSVFVHPVMKKRFCQENEHSETNLKLIEKMSQPGSQIVADLPSPRFIKTHLPMSLLPPQLLDTARVVYIARDPRDVAVSFYHLNRTIRTQGYIGDFKTYWHYFMNNLHHWTPFFEHLKEAWAQRHHPNMLFLFYEELYKDLPAAVPRVADFLNKKFTEEQVHELCNHLNFNNFKNNRSVNFDAMRDAGIIVDESFVRKGKSGGWREYFDNEMTEQAESWIRNNLKNTDLRFQNFNS